jgi:hypothetical protein
MPKTSMDEYADAAGWKDEVGFAGKLGCMQAVPKPLSMKKTTYNELRLRIFAPDLPHVSATPFGCEMIGHDTFYSPLAPGYPIPQLN